MRVFLAKIYAYAFFDQFILLYTSYSLLFRDSGLSEIQIGLLFAVLPVTTLIFEVPTGVLADKYSRRLLLFCAQLVKAMGYALWLVMPTYAGFIIGFALWGFATTLVSGTFESFVYDELKYFNLEKTYEKIHGRIDAAKFIGMTLATLLGGLVAEFGYDKVLIPSIVAPLIAGVLILRTPAAHSIGTTGERRYWHVLKEAVIESVKNHNLLQLILYFGVVFGVMEASHEFWGLYFSERSISLAYLGVIFAVANGVVAVAGFSAHLWELDGKGLYGYVLIACVSAIVLQFTPIFTTIFLSLVFSYVMQVALIKYEARMQHEISSSQRATVTSIKSLLAQFFAFAYFVGVGVLAKYFGFASFFWLAGLIIGCITVAYLMLHISVLSSRSS